MRPFYAALRIPAACLLISAAGAGLAGCASPTVAPQAKSQPHAKDPSAFGSTLVVRTSSPAPYQRTTHGKMDMGVRLADGNIWLDMALPGVLMFSDAVFVHHHEKDRIDIPLDRSDSALRQGKSWSKSTVIIPLPVAEAALSDPDSRLKIDTTRGEYWITLSGHAHGATLRKALSEATARLKDQEGG